MAFLFPASVGYNLREFDEVIDSVVALINDHESKLEKRFDELKADKKQLEQKFYEGRSEYDLYLDSLLNKRYFISELRSSLFNGLAVTMHSVYKHICEKMPNKLQKKTANLDNYGFIRNLIVHWDSKVRNDLSSIDSGQYRKNHRQRRIFIENNPDFFYVSETVKGSGNIKFSVTEEYLRKMSKDLREFFKNE